MFTAFKSLFYNYQLDRLEGDIESFEKEHDYISSVYKNDNITKSIKALLEDAKKAKSLRKYDMAWKYLNRARSMKVFYYDGQSDLSNLANIIVNESEKIKEWRKLSVGKLLLDKDKNLKKSLTNRDVFEAVVLRDEHYDNDGFKYTIRKKQLCNVLIFMFVVTILIYVLSYLKQLPEELNNPLMLLTIQTLGAFGALFSVAINLTTAPLSSSIKTERLASLLSYMKPLIGASAALAALILFDAGLFSKEIMNSNFAVYALAFASGFSERLVIKSLENIK